MLDSEVSQLVYIFSQNFPVVARLQWRHQYKRGASGISPTTNIYDTLQLKFPVRLWVEFVLVSGRFGIEKCLS